MKYNFVKTKAPTYISSYISNLDTGALTNDVGQHKKNNPWVYDAVPLDINFGKAIKQGLH